MLYKQHQGMRMIKYIHSVIHSVDEMNGMIFLLRSGCYIYVFFLVYGTATITIIAIRSRTMTTYIPDKTKYRRYKFDHTASALPGA